MNISLNHKIIPVILLMSLILLVSCSDSSKQQAQPQDETTTSQTKKSKSKTRQLVKAPDFKLKTMDGSTFTLSEHRGQVVVVNVWATWCPPCRKEIPDFVEIQQELRDKGVRFLGVSLDRQGWAVVRPFAKEYNINYPLALASATFARTYGPFHRIPVTFIIDQKGNIAYGGAGRINPKSLKKVLKKMVVK